MTRTELIEQLRENAPWCSNTTCDLQIMAADMLEADELIRLANIDCVNHFNGIKEDYDKLRVAARLALDALDHFDDVDKTEAATAALKAAL